MVAGFEGTVRLKPRQWWWWWMIGMKVDIYKPVRELLRWTLKSAPHDRPAQDPRRGWSQCTWTHSAPWWAPAPPCPLAASHCILQRSMNRRSAKVKVMEEKGNKKPAKIKGMERRGKRPTKISNGGEEQKVAKLIMEGENRRLQNEWWRGKGKKSCQSQHNWGPIYWQLTDNPWIKKPIV